MTSTVQDLRDALADEPFELRAPDVDAVMAGGRRLRRRRTTTRALGAVAAAALVVAGVAGVTHLRAPGAGAVLGSPDSVAEHAALARAAHEEADSAVRRFVRVPLDVAAWSGTRPDGEQGSRALPRDDREWATLQWLRFRADLPSGGSVFVLTQNEPPSDAAAGPPTGQEDRACTHVYLSCTTTRVPGGVVALEHGRTDDGERGLRASFTPDDPSGSWVLVEVSRPAAAPSPYTSDQLVALATDPAMSLPVPLAADDVRAQD
ncbi:hypothetical protein [Nocardioides marmoribigeumensis]|uniref:Anti-sigma factor n=1 Tax=Nocardioides marmoribigeumensis TaxID=433649 RepID=A0ABU2C0R5_9ACTN|nr:hypothetical protein [Nocardioides marmoribigeumensis]MDR7364223.1 hypothetical protein [Nocardioides marmoribigeumensis]